MTDQGILLPSRVLSAEKTVVAATMHNIGAALGLVILSGGATALGAAVVYIPSLVNLANNKTLAISLGLSAGVMLFVSFIEIFGKSQSSFKEAGFGPEQAYAMAMATFFVGALLMRFCHCLLGLLFGGSHTPHQETVQGEKNAKEMNRDESSGDPEEQNGENRLETHSSRDRAGCIDEDDDVCNRINGCDLVDDSSWGGMMLPCCVSKALQRSWQIRVRSSSHHAWMLGFASIGSRNRSYDESTNPASDGKRDERV
jgi:zinc transporter ZupT